MSQETGRPARRHSGAECVIHAVRLRHPPTGLSQRLVRICPKNVESHEFLKCSLNLVLAEMRFD
jgi:hypothetical protein